MDELKNLFKKLGYTEEDYNEIVNSFGIKNLKEETLIKKIEENYKFLKSLGYNQEEIIKMTKSLPAIYSLSIENIKQKIEFYDSINLHSLAVIAPESLMQSTKLSYARYQFFKGKDIEIDETNYRKLFVAQKQFEQQYGITKQELLERYPYEEEKSSESESKKIKRTQDLGVELETEQLDVEDIDKMAKRITGRMKEVNSKEISEK